MSLQIVSNELADKTIGFVAVLNMGINKGPENFENGDKCVNIVSEPPL